MNCITPRGLPFHFKMRKKLAGGWDYDPDSTEELTLLPKKFAALGEDLKWVGWEGKKMEGE